LDEHESLGERKESENRKKKGLPENLVFWLMGEDVATV